MDSEAVPALSRNAVDPAGHLRGDEEWSAKAWNDPHTRVLVLEGGEPGGYGPGALRARQTRALVTTGPNPRLVLTSPDRAPKGERYLLGHDGDHAYFAVRSHEEMRAITGAEPASLRDVGAVLDDRDTGLFTRALALANWNAAHGFCPMCGARTRMERSGHVRICEEEGTEQFPRTDPAVIMLVHREHEGREEALLGNNPHWDARRFSVLAGFVDAGESLEQAVAREVAEETGVIVEEPVYVSSQPWPFPRSLMVGYTARAVGRTSPTDDEIAETRWFTREALAEATAAGEIVLPGRVSIARTLIEGWYGGELIDGP